MKFNEAKRGRSGVINVTSLLDVMFLLVIFLLVAAKYEREAGINVTLPTGVSQEKTSTPELIYVSITRKGELFIGDKKVARDKFTAALLAARKKMKDPILVIKSDKAAPAEYMIFVLDMAKQIKQTKIHIKAKP